MDPTIDATILLCDAASGDSSGKMHMLGAGWSITGSPTAPCAVVVLLKVPWERAEGKLPFVLRLVDADGHPVVLEGKQVGLRQELGIGRRAQVPAGVPIDASFNLNLGPMALPPGRYRWVLEIGEEAASTGFSVVAKKPSDTR